MVSATPHPLPWVHLPSWRKVSASSLSTWSAVLLCKRLGVAILLKGQLETRHGQGEAAGHPCATPPHPKRHPVFSCVGPRGSCRRWLPPLEPPRAPSTGVWSCSSAGLFHRHPLELTCTQLHKVSELRPCCQQAPNA